MLQAMTFRQFAEWQTFEALEPFAPDRLDLLFASIVQALQALWRRKGTPAPKLDECRLYFGDAVADRPRRDPEEMLAQFKAMVASQRKEAERRSSAKRR